MTPTATRRRAVIALGSNLGERLENLQGALDALLEAPGMNLVAVSPVYESTPVGGPEQPDFLNAVFAVDTALSPEKLLERAQSVEDAFGRIREAGLKWGPRTVDVDLVVVGDHKISDSQLTLPHPRAHERAFVLVPWSDVDPDAELPGYGRVADLAAGIGHEGIRRRAEFVLQPPA